LGYLRGIQGNKGITYRHLNAPLIRPRQQQYLEREQPAHQADSEGLTSWSAAICKEREEEWEGEGYGQWRSTGGGDQKCC
jgi:hypothetical protein